MCLQENQERVKKIREQQRERELQFRKQQRERAEQGARPFFLKNCKNVYAFFCSSTLKHSSETWHIRLDSAAEKKKLQLAEKYEQLKKSGKLENFLSKKRKRNAMKDRRKLPEQQSKKKTWGVQGPGIVCMRSVTRRLSSSGMHRIVVTVLITASVCWFTVLFVHGLLNIFKNELRKKGLHVLSCKPELALGLLYPQCNASALCYNKEFWSMELNSPLYNILQCFPARPKYFCYC